MNDDDRPVFSDVGYFTRGRRGYRSDPAGPGVDWPVVLGLITSGLAIGGFGVLVLAWFGVGR